MTVQSRIRAIRIAERLKNHSDLKQIINVDLVEKEKRKKVKKFSKKVL